MDTKPHRPMIKGAGNRAFWAWYRRERGPEAVAEVLSRMPPHLREVFRADDPYLGILAASWYPAEAIHALIDAACRDLSPEEIRQLASEGGRVIIEEAISGIYRFLFRTMMTPERYARRSQLLFERYYNRGTLTKETVSPTCHRTVIRDWTSHHPFLCELILHTGFSVYRALGCRGVEHERTGCISEGKSECSFLIRWA